MATQRQRSRRHARRAHHQHAQRARLREALEIAAGDALQTFSWKEIVKRMRDHGYEEGDRPGTWRRVRSAMPPLKRKAKR